MISLALMMIMAADAAPSRLDLVCLGAGSANKQDNRSVFATDSNGNSGWGNIMGNRSVPFDDQVNLWVAGGDGRIRMPRAMLPMFRGGEEGWFKLKDIEVTDTAITATVAVNFINSPKMRVDRLTGIISLSGKAGNYTGECQAYDPANVQRRF